MPEGLHEPLRALGEIVAGAARFVSARRRQGLPGRRLSQQLAALSCDLATLSALARRAAITGTNEKAKLRAAAFEAADRLSAWSDDLRKLLEADS